MPSLSDNRLTVQTLQAAGIHRRQSAVAGSLLRGAGLLGLGRRGRDAVRGGVAGRRCLLRRWWRGSGLGGDVRADGACDAEREREDRPAGAGPLLPEGVIERQLARADL